MPDTTHSVNAVDEAIQAAGSQVRLASRLGVTQQCITVWKQRGYVPVNRAIEIEATYGIPRIKLVSPRLRGLLTDFPTEVAA